MKTKIAVISINQDSGEVVFCRADARDLRHLTHYFITPASIERLRRALAGERWSRRDGIEFYVFKAPQTGMPGLTR